MDIDSTEEKEMHGEKEVRKYLIYKIHSYPLPQTEENGAIAILSTGGKTLGYHYKNGWNLDTGNRVGSKKKLIRFPDKRWSRWVLHDDGDPISIRWEYEDTIRNKYKKKLVSSEPSIVEPMVVDDMNILGRRSSNVLCLKGVVNPYMLTPEPTPPSFKHPNQWIFDIIEHFQGIFSKSPETVEKCCTPLWLLLKHYGDTPIPMRKPGNVKKDGILEEDHIFIADLFADMIENKDKRTIDIQDTFRSSKPRRVRDLFAALVFDSKAEEEETPIILGAINVPPHEKGSKGISISLPPSLRDYGFNSGVPGGFPDETSVITSPGYVTEPHRDYSGIKQHILHSKGLKVWLIWPPTRENLEAAAPFFSAEHKSIDFNVAKALDVLTGLEVCFCQKRDEWFTLESCAIHAVITVTASGHKNKLFVDYGSFDEWDFAYCLSIDSLVSTHRARGLDREERLCVIEELRQSCKAFRHWEALLKAKPKHPLAPKTKSRLAEIKRHTNSYIRNLSDSNTRSLSKRAPSPATSEDSEPKKNQKNKKNKNK
jgi:hypothetical protein